jgi:hypothetical protein
MPLERCELDQITCLDLSEREISNESSNIFMHICSGWNSFNGVHTHIHHENPKNLVRPVPKYAKGFGLSGSCFTRLTHDPEENAIFLAVACEVRVPTVGVRADLTHLVSPGHPT